MNEKYNLWATKDGNGFYAPLAGGFGDNQFPTISQGQDAVEQLVGADLQWIAPEDNTEYDPVYGYRVHKASNPDRYAEYEGIRYALTKCEKVPRKIAEVLPTIESLRYALKKGDVGFCDEAIIERIEWLESEGTAGCPGVYTEDCRHRGSENPQCYLTCLRNEKQKRKRKNEAGMNQATIEEVAKLLNGATYGSYTGIYATEVRRGALLEDKTEGKITAAEYVQLLDALNTHLETGSYEGCIIWRNAEANPLEEQQNE